MPMSKVLGCIRKVDLEYNIIEDNDRILVGISGGKDSMVLVEALRLYKFFSKKNYEIIPVTIRIGFENNDFEIINDYLTSNNLEYHIEDSDPNIYEVLKLNLTNANKLPCSLCSKMKKAAICKAAHKYNCNKIAFAHHGDDAIETLLMNAIYGGRISTFKIDTYLSNEKLHLIRPLAYCKEKDIINTQRSSNIPIIKSNCPNDKNTERENIKELLSKFYKLYPEAKTNFLKMLHNNKYLQLWDNKNTDE